MADRSPFSQDHIVVPLAGELVSVPHRNAAEWVNALHARLGPGGMLLGLVRENTREAIREDLVVGDLEADQLIEASHKLIETATDWKWWEAVRLLAVSADTQVLGRTVVKGMDPWELTVAQWCAGVYMLCTEHADEKGRMKFDAQLSTPPAGVEDDDSWGDMSFEAMVNQARNTPGMG